jgi:hypothetical protein
MRAFLSQYGENVRENSVWDYKFVAYSAEATEADHIAERLGVGARLL